MTLVAEIIGVLLVIVLVAVGSAVNKRSERATQEARRAIERGAADVTLAAYVAVDRMDGAARTSGRWLPNGQQDRGVRS